MTNDTELTRRRLTAIRNEVGRYRTKAASTAKRDPAIDRAFGDVAAAVELAIEALDSLPWPQEQQAGRTAS